MFVCLLSLSAICYKVASIKLAVVPVLSTNINSFGEIPLTGSDKSDRQSERERETERDRSFLYTRPNNSSYKTDPRHELLDIPSYKLDILTWEEEERRMMVGSAWLAR